MPHKILGKIPRCREFDELIHNNDGIKMLRFAEQT